jgi:NAD+ synthase (glutamine-hydrolysing)
MSIRIATTACSRSTAPGRPSDLRGPVVRRADRLDTVARGAQLVLVPNASPFERDKHAQRDTLLAQRTGEWTGAAIAYLNVVGGQDALVFDGASVVADGDGTCIRPRRRSPTSGWWSISIRPRGRFTPVQWMEDGDESRDRAWPGAPWCAAPATTAPRTASSARGWGFPAASIRRWCWRSPSDALGAGNVTAVRHAVALHLRPERMILHEEQCARDGREARSRVPIEKRRSSGFLDTLAPKCSRARHGSIRPRKTCSRARVVHS